MLTFSQRRLWWGFTCLTTFDCAGNSEIFHYFVALGTHTSSTCNNFHICSQYSCCFSEQRLPFFSKEFIHRNLVGKEIFDLLIKQFYCRGLNYLNAIQGRTNAGREGF